MQHSRNSCSPGQHRHVRMQSAMSQRRCNLLLVEDQLDLATLMEHALRTSVIR